MTSRAKFVFLFLLILAVATQVAGLLYWYTQGIHVQSSGLTWLMQAIHCGLVIGLGALAIRGNTICMALLGALMVWYARGAFLITRNLDLGAPGEREIIYWASSRTLLYLLLALSFFSYFAFALARRRRVAPPPVS